jgi:hypothetical protein
MRMPRVIEGVGDQAHRDTVDVVREVRGECSQQARHRARGSMA